MLGPKVLAGLLAFWLAQPSAEPAPAGTEEPASPTASAAAPAAPPRPSLSCEGAGQAADAADCLRWRARAIHELLLGTLDPQVDLSLVLTVDLAGVDIDVAKLLERVKTGRDVRRRRAKRTEPQPTEEPSDPVEATRAELVDALAQYMALPADRRHALVDTHAARQRAFEKAAGELEQKAARLAEIERQTRELAALMRGDLDLDVDPEPLLRIDLGAGSESGLDDERLGRWLGDLRSEPGEAATTEPRTEQKSGAENGGLSPAVQPDDLDARLSAATAELDRLRLDLLARPVEARRALLDAHRKRQEEARLAAQEAEAERELESSQEQAQAESLAAHEQAAREAAEARERALEAARRARSEAARLVAEENARLLGVREAQANFAAELARTQQESTARREVVLTLRGRAQELENREQLASPSPEGADGLYDELVGALVESRAELDHALSQLAAASGVPDAGSGLDERLAADVDRVEVDTLRTELVERARELRDEEADARWTVATALRDDIVILNGARLDVLRIVSADKRERVTGFGPEGVEQVGRELHQMALQLRFHVLSLPREMSQLLDEATVSPVPALWAVVQVVLAFVVFRWWRRRAEGLLGGMRRSLLQRQRDSRLAGTGAQVLWYLMRTRQPVEWFAFLAVVVTAMGSAVRLPELEFVWLVLAWLLAGLFVVLLLDALAARQQLRVGVEDGTATLRMRSLRLVGLVVVLLGLLLSLTEESVGRGGIYGWVLSAVWLLALPVAAVLASWWRPVVQERLTQRPAHNALSKWVLGNRTGPWSHLAAAVGGVYLLGIGLWQFGVRQVAALKVTRKALAYLFRREVARQAKRRRSDEQLELVPDETVAPLLPDAEPSTVVSSVAASELEDVGALVASRRSTLTAVVGERGAGKSVFLARVRAGLEAGESICVRCPTTGLDGLLVALAGALGVPPDTSRSALAAALRTRKPALLCIDDAHHLVRPVIGGMVALDDFVAFAREVGEATSWVMSLRTAIWSHVVRARSDRAVFDQVIELEPWSEDAIADLVRTRTEAAGLDPSFDDLVVPRQLEDGFEIDSADRAENSYYRILWDYADGNPAVALCCWRASLARAQDGGIVVRLFDGPSPTVLEDLPNTIYFVLRALVQLEPTTEEDIVACTMLQAADVADALRFARVRGWVERDGDQIMITWTWYRAVSTALRRQHLLTS